MKLSEEQKKIIEEGYHSIERVTSLINGLLKFVEVEEGRYICRFKPLEIEKILQKVLECFREKIEEKDFHFEFKLPDRKLPKVKADKEKITIVLENFIGNAVRYTPKGGVVVLIFN